MPAPADPAAGGSPKGDAAVRVVVADHVPRDEREEKARRQVLALLDERPQPADRYGDPHHLTASAVVTSRRGVLLHVHKRIGRWMQPGGHIDDGETPWEAARREVAEETGMDAAHPSGGPRLVHVDVHPVAEDHVHYDLRYLLVTGDDDPAPPEGESQQVQWFAWDEALSVADEALAGALRAARAQVEATVPPTEDMAR